MTEKQIIVTGFAVVFLIVIFTILMSSFETIEASNRGLLFTFGELQNEELDEGFHLKIPFVQKIKSLTIQPIGNEINIPVGDRGAITKDNQTVGTTITLFYRYRPGQLVKLYRDYGLAQMETITAKIAEESFKKIIGSYTIFQIATSQAEIIGNLREVIVNEVSVYPIELTDVRLTNFDWSEQFNQQIENTMKRAQEVRQKEQELLITEQEANKKIKEAEATRQARIIEAEGEFESTRIRAEAKVLEGEGIRKYNESIARNLNVEIRLRELEIQKIEKTKWNGQYVPLYWYGPIPVQTNNGFVGAK